MKALRDGHALLYVKTAAVPRRFLEYCQAAIAGQLSQPQIDLTKRTKFGAPVS